MKTKDLVHDKVPQDIFWMGIEGKLIEILAQSLKLHRGSLKDAEFRLTQLLRNSDSVNLERWFFCAAGLGLSRDYANVIWLISRSSITAWHEWESMPLSALEYSVKLLEDELVLKT